MAAIRGVRGMHARLGATMRRMEALTAAFKDAAHHSGFEMVQSLESLTFFKSCAVFPTLTTPSARPTSPPL